MPHIGFGTSFCCFTSIFKLGVMSYVYARLWINQGDTLDITSMITMPIVHVIVTHLILQYLVECWEIHGLHQIIIYSRFWEYQYTLLLGWALSSYIFKIESWFYSPPIRTNRKFPWKINANCGIFLQICQQVLFNQLRCSNHSIQPSWKYS